MTSATPRGRAAPTRVTAVLFAVFMAVFVAVFALAGCRMPAATDAAEPSSSDPSSPSSDEPTADPSWPGGDTNQQPTPVDPIEANLSDIKTELMEYHDSGEYLTDVAAMADDAQRCMVEKREGVAKPALVLDIDETALSNYQWMVSVDFLRNSPLLSNLFAQQADKAATPGLAPTLKLYRAARQADVTVFFITGRSTALQQVTEENLRKVGYSEFGPSVFHPPGPPEPSVVLYKSGARAKIAEQGYTIIANVGDQNSDLEGGYGECQHKLPNPYYYIP
ncbi:MAG TPA: HAD family acid phosphatase [Microlunatus sp.]